MDGCNPTILYSDGGIKGSRGAGSFIVKFGNSDFLNKLSFLLPCEDPLLIECCAGVAGLTYCSAKNSGKDAEEIIWYTDNSWIVENFFTKFKEDERFKPFNNAIKDLNLKLQIIKIKAHSGIKHNERCDKQVKWLLREPHKALNSKTSEWQSCELGSFEELLLTYAEM